MDGTAQTTDFDACSLTPSLSTYYHNGSGTIPAVNDFVYTDALGTTLFDGVFKWYYVDNGGSDFSIQVSNTGQVLEAKACAGVTTTTTTTTVAKTYYTYKDCNDGIIAGKLFFLGPKILATDTAVKASDGNCYKIRNVDVAGGPELEILFVYNSCYDCQ